MKRIVVSPFQDVASMPSIDKDYETYQCMKPVDVTKPDLTIREHDRIIPILLNNFPKDSIILDAGCRYGTALKKMRDLGFVNIIGMDINWKLVKHLTENTDINCVHGDIQNLSQYFPENYFDFVYARHVIEHCPHPEKAMMGISKILRPGGYAYVIVPRIPELREYHYHIYNTLDQFVKNTKLTGLKIVCYENAKAFEPELRVTLEKP